MAENKSDDFGVLEKLALIAESLQATFKGKSTVVCELDKDEYKPVISHFREIDRHHKQFSIVISGTEFHFIQNETEDES